MRAIDLRLNLFAGEPDRERSERAMHMILHALCCINYEYLKRYRTPLLYKSGVRYDNAHAGKKEWQDVPKTLERRLGDCKDLACWKVAEYWRQGVNARPYIRYKTKPYKRPNGTMGTLSLYHVLVQLPDGTLEDPSRILGMGQSPWTAMARVGEEEGAVDACPACSATHCHCGNWCCCGGYPVCRATMPVRTVASNAEIGASSRVVRFTGAFSVGVRPDRAVTPVRGATVLLVRRGREVARAVTGSDGRYAFAAPAALGYRLRTRVGGARYETPDLPADGNNEVNLTAWPDGRLSWRMPYYGQDGWATMVAGAWQAGSDADALAEISADERATGAFPVTDMFMRNRVNIMDAGAGDPVEIWQQPLDLDGAFHAAERGNGHPDRPMLARTANYIFPDPA